jgi:DNA-binding CsgD family transcriptional regulator
MTENSKKRTTTQLAPGKKNVRYPSPLGDGVVLVNEDFEIVALNDAAEAILRSMRGTDAVDVPGLPPEILNPLKAGSDLQSAQLSVTAYAREYSCRSFVIRPCNGDVTQPVLALYLRQEMSMTDTVRQVSEEYRLTDREQQALMGVVMGLSSKELATRMQISPNTVKVFVRLIMIKMSATTRAGIVGKLIDHNRHLLADFGAGAERPSIENSRS